MKKFNFSLQNILNLREFEEKQSQIDLGKAISECTRLKNELEQVAQDYIKANNNRTSEKSIEELIIIDNYCNRLNLLKEELLEQIATAELIVQQKQEIYAEKLKNRKVLTKLKEKKYSQWKKECLHEEEIQIDDIVTSKFSIK